MKINLIATLLPCAAPAMFAADGATAVRGTVESVDLMSETVVIETPGRHFCMVSR